MNNTNLQILDLINQNKNMKEIASTLNLTEKQLYIRIKNLINYGYNLYPSYSYNSDIYYKHTKARDDSTISIKMPKDENLFKCLVISDLHIGSVDSDIKLIDTVYDYAIKNGINTILSCGDNLEGDYTCTEKSIPNIHDQIEYFIRKYPYDKNINNFMIFGNHDYHSLIEQGLDITQTIANSRHDIVPISYGQGSVNIKNDNIILFHQLKKDYKPVINNEKVLLSGHSHMMKTKIKDIFWISLPTLSYKSNDKTKEVIPGFVELKINIENGKFEYVEAKHLIINPKIIQVSETRGKVKNLFNDRIKR